MQHQRFGIQFQWGVVGGELHLLVIWLWTLHHELNANMVYGDHGHRRQKTENSDTPILEKLGHDTAKCLKRYLKSIIYTRKDDV